MAADGQTQAVASDFEGALEEGGLALAIERVGAAAAEIVCSSFSGETATLWLRDGQLLDVQLGWRSGAKALLRLLTWPSGWYHARVAPQEHEAAIGQPAAVLLSELQHRAVQWAQAVRELGGLETVFEVNFASLATRLAEIPDNANTVLRLIDGQRGLGVLLDASPLDELETLSLVGQLAKSGILRGLEVTPPAHWIPEAVRAGPAIKVESVSEEVAASDILAETPTIEAIPLSSIVLEEVGDDAAEWAQRQTDEITQPSRRIPVLHFPGEHGARRRRLDAEAAALRERLSQQKDRATLLTQEVFLPGAKVPAGVTPAQVERGTSDAFEAYFEQRLQRKRIVSAVAAVVLLGGTVVVGWSWSARRASTQPPALPIASLQSPLAVVAPGASPFHEAEPLPKSRPVVDKTSFDELVASAQKAVAAGQRTKAIELYEEASAMEKTAPVLRELGKAYYNADKLSAAIDRLRQATVLDGKDAEAFMYLGTALQDAHRLNEARAAYKRFLALEPASSRRHAEIAAVVQHLERP